MREGVLGNDGSHEAMVNLIPDVAADVTPSLLSCRTPTCAGSHSTPSFVGSVPCIQTNVLGIVRKNLLIAKRTRERKERTKSYQSINGNIKNQIYQQYALHQLGLGQAQARWCGSWWQWQQ